MKLGRNRAHRLALQSLLALALNAASLSCLAEQGTNPCVSLWGALESITDPVIDESKFIINSSDKRTVDNVDTLVACLKEDPVGSGNFTASINADISYTSDALTAGIKQRADTNGCKPPEQAPFQVVLDEATWALSGFPSPSTVTPTSGTGQTVALSATAPEKGTLTFTLKFKGDTTPPNWSKTVTKAIGVIFVKVTSVSWVQKEGPVDDAPATPPGGGKRIFPDASTAGGAAQKKVTIEAAIQPAVKGINIDFRIIDVDDPSSDAALDDPSKQDDNLEAFTLLATTAATDSSGKAKVDVNVSMHPGDNVRAVATAGPSISAWKARQNDGTKTRVEDGSGSDVPSTQVSPLLTVWRKLHIEVDVMEKPLGSRGSPDQVSVTGLSLSPFTPTRLYATLNLNADLPEEGTGDPANYESEFYAGGLAKIGGRRESIQANGESSLVFKMPPPPYTPINDSDYANSARTFFQPFINSGIDVCDDDGVSLGFDLLPVSDPISDQVKARFLPACIKVEAVSNDLNPRRNIPFDLYSMENGTLITGGSSLNDLQDMEGSDSPDYWYWFVAVGYQGYGILSIPVKYDDGDPNDEGYVGGATIGGFTKVFVAAVDEYSAVRGAANKAVAFFGTLSDIIAHEIGHGPNSHGNGDHSELGLMSDGEAAIGKDFSGLTLSRFRKSSKWSE